MKDRNRRLAPDLYHFPFDGTTAPSGRRLQRAARHRMRTTGETYGTALDEIHALTQIRTSLDPAEHTSFDRSWVYLRSDKFHIPDYTPTRQPQRPELPPGFATHAGPHDVNIAVNALVTAKARTR